MQWTAETRHSSPDAFSIMEPRLVTLLGRDDSFNAKMGPLP